MRKNMMMKTCVIFLIPILSLMLSSLKASTAADLPKSVAIATHAKGSSLNAVGSGLAKVISSHTPISAADRPFTGNITWLPLLNKGQVDMGVIASTELYFGYQAVQPYKEPLKDLRLVSSSDSSLKLTFVVRGDSDIKTVANLKGKRVTIDKTSLITFKMQDAVIRAAGMDPEKDIIAVPVAGVVPMVNAFVEGRTDTTWASFEMGKIKEAAAKVGKLHWLSVCQSQDDDAANTIRRLVPGVDVKYIKAGEAPEVHNNFWLVNLPITLATHRGMPDEAVYQITKAIAQNQKELSPIHPMLKDWVAGMVDKNAVIPYHPGAIRFYKEAGIWPADMEQIQEKLLKQ